MKCDSTDHWFFFLRMAVVIFEKTELFLSASTNEVREMDNDVFDMLAFVCVCVCVGVFVCVSLSFCVVMGDDSSLFPIDGCYQVDARSPC